MTLKDKEAEKEYKREYYKRPWVKEKISIRQRKLIQIGEEDGRCTKCYSIRENPKKRWCLDCRMCAREFAYNRKIMKMKGGQKK